jgi:molecular chaperone DnaK
MPQIEVTFDIDANGIVNVSAKDMGTGKEQRITITSSTKLSDEEIKSKIKEAEQYAEEDKRKKEEIDVRNHAETLVYETEKSLKEIEPRLSEDEKSRINNAKDELAKALESGGADLIKQKTEALTNEFHTISAKMYEQAQNASAAGAAQAPGGEQAGAGPEGEAPHGNVVDADYEVVDDNASSGGEKADE